MQPIEQRSHLHAPAEVVWARVTTFAGVNDELRPLLRMTLPSGVEALDPASVVPGRLIGRSRLLLFGLMPIDYDDITLVALEPGRGFHERSTMLSMRRWEHERRVEPLPDGGCVVSDRVSFEPRLPVPAALAAPLVRLVFRHRHKRLHLRFGGESLPS